MARHFFKNKHCAVCKTRTGLTRHHVVHKAKGGKNHHCNYQWLCRTCHDKAHKLRIPSGKRVTLKLIRSIERARTKPQGKTE